EGDGARVERGARAQRAADRLGVEGQALLDVPHHLGLELRAVALEQRAVLGGEGDGAQRVKRLACTREVGGRLFDRGAELADASYRRLADRAHLAVERQEAEIGRPADAAQLRLGARRLLEGDRRRRPRDWIAW